jgi:type I site-specific restriction endonuclease
MQFTEGQTATFTMTAFTQAAHRKTRIFGSKGELEGDGRFIKIFDFLTDKTTEIDTEMNDGIMQGHGGGDFGIMQNFVDALISDNPEMILSGADESLESHLMVFRAEESRLEKQMKEI